MQERAAAHRVVERLRSDALRVTGMKMKTMDGHWVDLLPGGRLGVK